MSIDVKTEFQIPDLWFDFYARVLPGTAFISMELYVNGHNTPPTSFISIVFIVGLGYFLALLTQPISSRVTGWIERLDEKCRKINDSDYIKKIQTKLGSESRRAMIIGKMHAEVTFFVQLGIFAIISLIIECCFAPNVKFGWIYYILFLILCLLSAFEVADRRLKRAQAYNA